MSFLTFLATVFYLLISLVHGDRYIESIAANVDAALHPAKSALQHKHESFVPLVAFKCGYRNKFLNKKGDWQDDSSSAASCLHGKLNILKYCKRVYPEIADKITNIVDYSHQSRIDNWCKEDGSDCHSKYTVRPFRCLVGEFVTEALQVPNKCHFSHIAGKNKCNDYKFWNVEAEKQCAAKLEEGSNQSMRLHSFAILEPCGIDMFRGVEYVCCPKSVEEKVDTLIDLEKDADEDADDDDEDYSDEDDDEDDDEVSTQKSVPEQDPYFKDNQNSNEHDRFRDAMERLERKHRKRVTKVITQWSELFERYNHMKETDQKGADNYKREMTAKFRKTVAALEEENREQRKQIEEVHNERVQAALNDKKRQATHDYRAALALQVGTDNKESVLHTLKAYIKAEEKDRTHMLNRYRHLLRSDPDGARQFEPVLLHRLRYIDLRINGTLAMLRDFPALETEVRPIAEKFWKDYRFENTPEGAESEGPTSRFLSEDERNERLIKFYKKTFEKNQSVSELSLAEPKDEEVIKVTPTKPSTIASTKKKLVALKDVLSEREEEADSDEDQFEDSEDDQRISVVSKTAQKSKSEKPTDVTIEFVKGPEETNKKEKLLVKVPIKVKGEQQKVSELSNDASDEESDEGESDEAEGSYVEANDKTSERELHIAVEPIMLSPKGDFEVEINEVGYLNRWISQTNLLIGVMALAMIMVFFIARRRSRRRGFIEVEIHNPEDKHVNALQVNGYENPTYSFFEKHP